MAARIGQLLGERWKITSQTNSGGQGTVYIVTDKLTSEKCAAKVFRIRGHEKQKIARAKTEIEAIKKLAGSTNVVQIKDENISSAEPETQVELYYVTDYAVHGSLADNDFYIGDVEQCLRIFREILIGIREAHRKGVIHRDLKPANILLHPTQRHIVITDFGLGLIKDREADEKITEPDELLGARFFMAPEQHVSPSDANERSDIYSLGKILYYMLTGKGKVFREQLDDINSSLQTPNPYIPQVQELLLNRMVAEKPEDRFIDVDGAIDEVDRIISQIELSSQRYLKPADSPYSTLIELAGSRRDLIVAALRQDAVIALSILEDVIISLREGNRSQTIESLKSDLLNAYPRGKLNAAIKALFAFILDPKELATSLSTAKYSFASYYMSRYYVQSLAYGTAHRHILKAVELERDASLQLKYLLIFGEICRKCTCNLPHNFEQHIMPLLRTTGEDQRPDLLKTLGKYFLEQGQQRRGLRLLEAYLDARPYDHSTRFECAYAYASLGDAGPAVHHYSILEPHKTDYTGHAIAVNNLATAYDSNGLRALSLAKYREAYELGSTISGANIAKRYIDIGMLDEAKELLDEIIIKYPKTYHENVAQHLGAIVTERRDEEKKKAGLKATGALVSHHHVQVIRSSISDESFSWVGSWLFGEVNLILSETDGVITPRIVTPEGSEFRCLVDGNTLEVTMYKKRFEVFNKYGIFYLTTNHSFSGYLVAGPGVVESITGTKA